MLSSLSRARLYVDHIWVREGEPTRIKIIVSHDLKAAAFNSIEFAKAADDLDGAVSVCVIQASHVVVAGYLMGSRKTMVNNHWNSHFNNHLKLNNMDVQVQIQKIKDNSSGPWNPKNNVVASHILCSAEDEKLVNRQMCSLYNKQHKTSRAANDLSEGCSFRYVPLE